MEDLLNLQTLAPADETDTIQNSTKRMNMNRQGIFLFIFIEIKDFLKIIH